MANKDYPGALTFAKDIPAKAGEVLARADATKTALEKAWTEAGEGMTKTVAAAKIRLHVLSREKKLPTGMDKAAFDKFHSDLAAIEAGWAVAQAKDLNGRGLELLRTIGVKEPPPWENCPMLRRTSN